MSRGVFESDPYSFRCSSFLGVLWRGSCWRVKLGDFGSSVLMASDAEASVGGVWGTEGYRAPEVDAGLPHTPASDMWSLGVVLAYLVEASVDPANAAVSV